MNNEKLAKEITYYMNPHYQNVVVNASEDLQKKIEINFPEKFDYNEPLSKHVFYLLKLNGKELMNDLKNIRPAIGEFCKNETDYDNELEKEYRKLQETDTSKLSKEAIMELFIAIGKLGRKRVSDSRYRLITHNVLVSYVVGLLLNKLPKEFTNLDKYYEDDIEKRNEMLEIIKIGDFDKFREIDWCHFHNITDLCNNIYKKTGSGIFTLIKNGENIMDSDLHSIINIFMAQRSSSLSMNLMTKASQMYTYYVQSDFHLEEIHDIHTHNVNLIRKR